MKTKHTLVALALCTAPLLLATNAAASTTTVTTNLYSSTSLSKDIAESCRDVSVSDTTGVLSATCNKADENGDAADNATSIDLDDVLYCKVNEDPTYPVVLVWGSTTSDYSPSDWSMEVSSSGYDYHGFATCKSSTDTGQAQSGVSLSDTVKGLKNDGGDLKAR